MDFDTNIDKPNKKTLAEQAYDILYKSIIYGKLKPGDELVEQQLSEMLQVSRTPVREALKRLKAMDLVEGSSHSKMTVKGITMEEIDEVTDLRTLLEIYTIESAVDKCTAEDIRLLEEILEKSYMALQSDNIAEIIALNTLFHETLNKISGKKMAIQMLGTLRDILNRHRIARAAAASGWHNYEAHIEIINALKNKDKKKAVEEIARHMAETKEASLMGIVINE